MKPARAAAVLLALAGAPAFAAGAPSVYIQCDGKARGMGIGEGLARLPLVIGTMGLAGAGESDNARERLFAKEGAAACDQALAEGRGKSDDIRRSQLILARAVHHIEAKDYDAALADVRAFPAAGGAKAQERGFQRSLALSAIELEAATLVRAGRPAEAEAAALRFAAADRYEVTNQLRALRYVGLTTALGPEKLAFYRDLARLLPEARQELAVAQEWAGDYAGAAASLTALLAILPAKDPSPLLLARAAIEHAMAGDPSHAAPLLEQARRAADDLAALAAGGTDQVARMRQEIVSRTDESIDFARVVQALRDGRTADARKLFAARSRWLAPPIPAVALVTEQLARGAAPAERTGALDRDPAAMRADAQAQRLKSLTSADADKALYLAIRAYSGDGAYTRLARDSWTIAGSRYLQKQADALPAEVLSVPFGYDQLAAGKALLLHAALLARSRGKPAFAILPPRSALASARVAIGEQAGVTIPADAWLDAATLISVLALDIPQPVPPK